jgi:hypothetical protein
VPPGPAPAPGTPGGEATAKASEDIDLGVIELKGDGQSIRMANDTVKLSIPNEQLAIRIDKPSDLKLFNNDRVGKLRLENANPVDLLPQPDGSWRGQMQLPDGGRYEVVLQPAGT